MAKRDRTARVAGGRRRSAPKDGAEDAGPAPVPAAISARIFGAWRDPWGVARAERLAAPSEPKLLAYALVGCFALWLARLPAALRDAAQGRGPEAGADPTLLTVASLVAMMFFTPLFLYGLAALARVVLRLFGGGAGWREARTAMFWSLLPAAPAFLLGYAATFALVSVGAPAALAATPRVAADLAWLRFWSVGLAEANGFRSAWPIFAVIAAIALAFLMAEPGTLSGSGSEGS